MSPREEPRGPGQGSLRSLRCRVGSWRALGVACLAVIWAGLAHGSGASAAGLPAVTITYTGNMSIEVFPTEGKPSHQLRTLSWTATANSAGSDGGLALDYTTVAGSASLDGSNNCYDSSTTISLAAAKNPVANGWNLNETSNYPSAGWKYIALGVPELVPLHEAVKGRCSSVEFDVLAQPNEMLEKQETFSPAQLKEYEAILEPFEFAPGKAAGRTRTFSFDGISHCTCLPAPTHIKESMTLTVSATSPAAGNNVKTNPPPAGGGPSPKSTPPARKVSEARRKEVKEQAREDLGPALEEAWKAHGLSVSLGLNSGLAWSTVLDELGQTGTALDGNDANVRVIDDYRIIGDPPDNRFRRLAKPRAPKTPALRSCAAAPAAEQALCTTLRAAEIAMLTSSARAVAITDTLLVTMNRESTAIGAHDYADAQRQYVHFQSLHRELVRVLASRAAGGARVAAVFRSVGASGILSRGESATAISAVGAVLRLARIPASGLRSLAKGALEARETNALDSLAEP